MKRAEKKVRYFVREDYKGLTRSQLKRTNKADQILYMTQWFLTYYEDPSNETPRDDGDYAYVWGGPYDATEELRQEFDGLVPVDRIDAAARAVERRGTLNWAPSSRHPSQRELNREFQFAEERPKPSREEQLLSIIESLARGMQPNYGSSQERAERRDILDRLSAVESEIGKLKPAHGEMGHNNPPADVSAEDEEVLEDAQEVIRDIKGKITKEKPDAREVAEKSNLLLRTVRYLAKKAAETGVEEVTKKIWESPPVQAGLGALAVMIANSIDRIIDWLLNVTIPF